MTFAKSPLPRVVIDDLARERRETRAPRRYQCLVGRHLRRGARTSGASAVTHDAAREGEDAPATCSTHHRVTGGSDPTLADILSATAAADVAALRFPARPACVRRRWRDKARASPPILHVRFLRYC